MQYRLSKGLVVHATIHLMQRYGFPAILRRRPETLQVNLGYRCNQSCMHCHVNAGPNRAEQMSRETADDVLAFLAVAGLKKLDVTGGAPELNPHFRSLVARARDLGVHVIDRCNLTILEEPGKEDLAAFLAQHRVEVTLLSVDWQGYVYDCDFNQMLGLPLGVGSKRRVHVSELKVGDLAENPIEVRDHCYGCTAGQGSSCGGALDAASESERSCPRTAHG